MIELADRHRQIEDLISALTKSITGALVADTNEERVKSEEKILASGMSLLQVGLSAMADIADAQQRIAAVAEADIESAITNAVAEIEADIRKDAVAEHEKSASARGFIGRKN